MTKKNSIPWNKGKTGVFSEEALKKMSNKRKIWIKNNLETFKNICKENANKLGHEHYVKLGKTTKERHPNQSYENGKKTQRRYPNLKNNLIHTKEHSSKAGKIGAKRLHEKYPKEFFVNVGRKAGLNSAISKGKKCIAPREERIMRKFLPNDFVQNEIFMDGVPDFRSDERKIIIEVDGEYWHSKEEVKERDIKQTKEWMANGYAVFRFMNKEVIEYMLPILGCKNGL